jgi:outer membrane biosynthesis protein TonB
MKLPKSVTRFKTSTWALGATLLLALIMGVATGGFGGLLITAGLIGLGTALYAFVTGRKSWAGITSRKSAAIVVAACLVATIGGSAVYGATHDSDELAAVTESASPSPSHATDVKPTATPSDEPSPSVTPEATPEPTPSIQPTPVVVPVPVAPAPAPVAPAPKPAPPAPAPAPPAPAPAPGAVHAGSYCSVAGATGVTTTGKAMACKTSSTDSRLRWRAA